MTCSLLIGLFLAALVRTVAGHGPGLVAWRHRPPQYSRWLWLHDRTYVFRSSYYPDLKPPIRYLAAGILVAAVLAVSLAAVLVSEREAGASDLCGFAL